MVHADVLASLIDPGDNGIDAGDLVLWATFVGSIVGTWAIVDKVLDKRRDRKRAEAHDALTETIKRIVSDATAPIQPSANGNSINGKVDVLVERQSAIAERTAGIADDVRDLRARFTDHLTDHE